MLTAIAAFLLAPVQNEVELVRTFTTGQTQTFEVKSHILTEGKSAEMSFYMPEEFDVNYGFTLKIEQARPDGFAVLVYERPTMNLIEGETSDHPPKTTIEKTGWKSRLTISPINELTDVLDLSPKKPVKGKDGNGGKGVFLVGRMFGAGQDGGIDQMIQELHSLAMFIGNLESSLDFSPKLPLDTVKPGGTWKKTVSYQPRELKGTDKQAVQRLDYTYKYEGLVPLDGKRVHRVTAVLELDTDAAKFINQLMGMKPEESGLKELRLQLTTKIVFDLDEKTKTTLSIVADSKGGFKIVTTENPETPVFEEKITGKSTLRLVSIR